jgi:hypothetical protein
MQQRVANRVCHPNNTSCCREEEVAMDFFLMKSHPWTTHSPQHVKKRRRLGLLFLCMVSTNSIQLEEPAKCLKLSRRFDDLYLRQLAAIH